MLHDFLKSLCIWICVPIYGLIPKIYSIFFNLANTRFLKSDLVEQFSANLYVLVSVIMLFGFSITILSAIVNPDLLSDSKKGVPAMFKRAIIGLALMVIIPFAFDEMYKIQENVMTNSLIEKIIVGADFSCDENDDSCEVGGNGGQVIAGTLIQSVLRPAEDTVETSQNIEEDYNNMIQKDITKINRIADSINITREDAGSTTEDGNHVFHFDGLIAIIVGAGVCYILILFALDMAVRIFKLAFLELTAPISIVGYIAAGDKIISSWFKEVGKTFLDVFIRIAAIAFYLFLINNLSSFMVDFEGKTWRYVLIAFLIIGMLIFAKQVPDMIGKIFGIDMKSQGGIAGRLGNMAGVGEQAKKAWTGIKNLTKAAPLVAGAGLAAVSKLAGDKLGQTALGQRINNNPAVQKLKNGMGKTSAVGSKIKDGVSSAVSTVKAAANESNPFKAYDKLMNGEGSKGAVRKEQVAYEKNKQAKATAREALSKNIGSNILDSDGNVVNASAATPAAYSSMVDQMKGHTQQQKDAMVKYNEKQHDLFVAQKDNQTINQIRTAIETKMNASTGTVKTDLANILAQMDLGGIKSISDLNTKLNSSGVDQNFVDAITGAKGVANNLSSSNLGSIASYSSAVDSAQEEFSRADSTLNDVIGKATADQQVVMKEARTISKKMNEANTK